MLREIQAKLIKLPLEEQNEAVSQLAAQENELGIYKLSLGGGVGHMSAWFYGHNISACYEWLLTQTREDEMNRQKPDLDKPFAKAENQIQTPERLIAEDKENSENNVYFVTGEKGSGTAGYNSAIYYVNGGLCTAPGWTPSEN